MTTSVSRYALRALLVSSLALCAFLLFGGRAHALTDTPPAAQPAPTDTTVPPVTTAETTPPPEAPVAQAESATPPAGAGGPGDPTGSGATPAANDSTANDSTANDSTANGATPTPDPANTNEQTATETSTGTADANTGSNTAVASGTGGADVGGTATSDPATGSSADAATGSASATGDRSTETINQQVDATADGSSTVDILQIAFVVNVGVAQSTSGDNVAGSASTPATTGGSITSTGTTGDARATGNGATTSIVQAANVGDGEQSSQTATALNIGIALSNTGLNITIGTIGSGGGTSAQALSLGPSSSTVGSGDASATGDASNSTITQIASANATGNALVSIDQRAIVINFGVAISNTGANFSLASFDTSALTPDEQAIVSALLDAIMPMLDGTSAGSAAGGTAAQISTGDASAIGTTSTSTVLQRAQGTASGSSTASASQVANIANFGLALANSGFNTALAGSSLPAGTQAQLAAAEDALSQFLALLTDPAFLTSANPFADFAQTVNLDGLQLDLGGSLDANDIFVGFDSLVPPDSAALPSGGVHVRQITGVLNIGIATADTGNNTTISIVTTTSNADAPDAVSRTLTTSTATSPTGTDVLAAVRTGNAYATGTLVTVTMCQAFHDKICDPPPEVVTHPQPPVVRPGRNRATAPVTVTAVSVPVPAAAAAAAEPVVPVTAGAPASLPFTGGRTTPLAGLGALLLGVGAALSRRRRTDERPARRG